MMMIQGIQGSIQASKFRKLFRVPELLGAVLVLSVNASTFFLLWGYSFLKWKLHDMRYMVELLAISLSTICQLRV